MYFVMWMHRWRQQQAIALQSEHVMTLAASVRCRRMFSHWKHRILSHLLFYPLASLVRTSSIYISAGTD